PIRHRPRKAPNMSAPLVFPPLSRRAALLGAGGLLAATALPGQAQADAVPKKGGSIRVAGYSSGTTDTVDPARQSLSTDYARCNMFYNGLTALDSTLTPQPVLAESIESQDARTWTIK